VLPAVSAERAAFFPRGPTSQHFGGLTTSKFNCLLKNEAVPSHSHTKELKGQLILFETLSRFC
jgi:hypothetical protein